MNDTGIESTLLDILRRLREQRSKIDRNIKSLEAQSQSITADIREFEQELMQVRQKRQETK